MPGTYLSSRLLPWRKVCEFGPLLVCGLVFVAGCHRAPRTAAELAKVLPRAFAGELHLQGDTEAHHIRIEPRQLSVRSDRVLEFNRMGYQVQSAQGEVDAEGEAQIRGTITVPGLDIRLEMLGTDGARGEDAVRPETFAGKLSVNLQSLDAEWSTGLGQKAHLAMQASP